MKTTVIRIYAILMIMLSLALIITTYLVGKTHNLSSVWIVYLLAAMGLLGARIAWRASTVKPQKRMQFNGIQLSSNGRCYNITEDPIQSGDQVFNIYTKDVDKCMAVFSDGTLGIEFQDGSFQRFVCHQDHYRKAAPV